MSQTDRALIKSLQSFVEGIPFAKRMNLKVNSARRGFVEVHVEPSHQLFNHFNTYQAGVYFTLGEVTGGLLCGTFLSLAKNLLITKKSNIEFNHATDNTLISIAELTPPDIEKLLADLMNRRKTFAFVDVFIKSSNGKPVARCRNEYYLRLGIPKSFSGERQGARYK